MPHADDNSQEAYESIQESLSALRTRVLTDILMTSDHGTTCDELEARTGLAHQTASARICELRDQQLIERTGARRQTRSGRNAWGYVITAKGCDLLDDRQRKAVA